MGKAKDKEKAPPDKIEEDKGFPGPAKKLSDLCYVRPIKKPLFRGTVFNEHDKQAPVKTKRYAAGLGVDDGSSKNQKGKGSTKRPALEKVDDDTIQPEVPMPRTQSMMLFGNDELLLESSSHAVDTPSSDNPILSFQPQSSVVVISDGSPATSLSLSETLPSHSNETKANMMSESQKNQLFRKLYDPSPIDSQKYVFQPPPDTESSQSYADTFVTTELASQPGVTQLEPPSIESSSVAPVKKTRCKKIDEKPDGYEPPTTSKPKSSPKAAVTKPRSPVKKTAVRRARSDPAKLVPLIGRKTEVPKVRKAQSQVTPVKRNSSQVQERNKKKDKLIKGILHPSKESLTGC